MKGRAYAKLNLSLRVRPRRHDGMHPIVSLAQSIDWADAASLIESDSDRVEVVGADIAEEENLAWQAVAALRAPGSQPVAMRLEKSIAVAAGLGGGSADAALGLVLATGLFGGEIEKAVEAAPRLGADVPFCLAGGTAWLEGVGEKVTPIAGEPDYHVAVVVPPFQLSTSHVYARWDDLGGPKDGGVGARHIPVSLREQVPLGNDLRPAAVSLVPELGDWMSDVAAAWGQPVLMSGSGPALFGFFGTVREAEDAVRVIAGARSSAAASPVGRGWDIDPDGTLPPPPWGVV